MPRKRPAPFMPAGDDVAYLANLLAVLAVLYGAYLIWRKDRATAQLAPRPHGPSTWGML